MSLLAPVSTKQALKNVIILGSGRCGTSMISGLLAKQDYYMGQNLYAGTDGNPKGYFESWEINSINEDLLAQVLPKRPCFIGRWFFRNRFYYEQRWLARLPVGTVIPSSQSINERIIRQTEKQPFCYKDPRFPYTLSAWRPFLKNTAFICSFRDPSSTVVSVLKDCKMKSYLHSLRMSYEIAMEMWILKYRHILETHRHTGDLLFVHFNQGFTDNGLNRISSFLNIDLDRNFPDRALDRSRPIGDVPAEAKRIYQELCNLAGYTEGTE